jgi:hypothetical protein
MKGAKIMARLIRLIKQCNLNTLEWQLTETIHEINEVDLLLKKAVIAPTPSQEPLAKGLQENDTEYLPYLEQTIVSENLIDRGSFKHRVTAEFVFWEKVNRTFKETASRLKNQRETIYIELVEREVRNNEMVPGEIIIEDSLEFYHPIFILSVTEG